MLKGEPMKRLLHRTIKLFTDRRAWVRQILVASAACGTAWLVGNTTINSGGVVAAIVCALSIRISLRNSQLGSPSKATRSETYCDLS